jgi:hypothetical protein
MSLEQLDKLIQCTQESEYRFASISIHGPGEPLLWKYFNEGMKAIHDSQLFGKIKITSNGLMIDKITPESWEYIGIMKLSIYPESETKDKHSELIRSLVDKYGTQKIRPTNMDYFRVASDEIRPIPGTCVCDGPMYYDGKIFPYCGPPAFNAAKAAGVDWETYPDLYTELKVGYMETPKYKAGNFDLCKTCWANTNSEDKWEAQKLETP